MGESAAAPLVEPATGGDDEPFLGLAWAEAIEATELLRSALAALGLAEEIPRLRGDVNVYGRPMVTVGRISPTAARRLAAALSRAAQQTRVYGQAPTVREGSGGCALPGALPSGLPGGLPGPGPLAGTTASVMPAAAIVAAAAMMPGPSLVPGAPMMPVAAPAAAPRTAGGLPPSPSDSMRLPA